MKLMRRFSSLPNTMFNSLLQDFHGHFAKSALTNIFLDYVLHGGTFCFFFCCRKKKKMNVVRYNQGSFIYLYNCDQSIYFLLKKSKNICFQ